MGSASGGSADTLLDLLPVGVSVVDDSWRISHWNRLLEVWTGRSRASVIGTELFTAFPQLAEARYRGRLRAVLDGGPPALFSPQLNASFFPCFLPDASPRRQRVTATLVREGDRRSLLMAVEDATEGLKQVSMVSGLRAEALNRSSGSPTRSSARAARRLASPPSVFSSAARADAPRHWLRGLRLPCTARWATIRAPETRWRRRWTRTTPSHPRMSCAWRSRRGGSV